MASEPEKPKTVAAVNSGGTSIPTLRVCSNTGKSVPSSIPSNRAYICPIYLNKKHEKRDNFKNEESNKHVVAEDFMKDLEKNLKKELFKYINEKMDDLERRIQMNFRILEAQLHYKGDEDFSDTESADFKSEDEEKEDKKEKSPENYFIGDDFDVDEFVDDIFKDADEESEGSASVEVQPSCELEVITAESMSSRDLQRAYIL